MMNLGLKNLIRRTTLFVAPLVLLTGSTAFAHDTYNDDRYHQQDEKQALKEHQREERYYYGNSRALREHQRQEKREVRRHQRDEREYQERGYYGDRGYGYDRDYRYGNGGYGNGGYGNGGYYGRRY